MQAVNSRRETSGFIRQVCSSEAGKVTGMLLEIDNSELLHMLEDEQALAAKVSKLNYNLIFMVFV